MIKVKKNPVDYITEINYTPNFLSRPESVTVTHLKNWAVSNLWC